MRAKLTILFCALLVLALGASQANAQGYLVSKAEKDVVQYGTNQELGALRLDYVAAGGAIDDGNSITITYSGLTISNPRSVTIACEGSFGSGTCSNITATSENDDDTGVGTVTVNLVDATKDETSAIEISGVRADVSGLDVGDDIMASINSSEAPTGFVPIDQSRTESVGGVVSTVKAGLAVEIGGASRLLCDLDGQTEVSRDPGTDGALNTGDDVVTYGPIGGVPSITLTEGFGTAWEDALGGTSIRIVLDGVPEGLSIGWPGTVTTKDPDGADEGELTCALEDTADSSVAICEATTLGDAVESATIDLTVSVDDASMVGGGLITAQAQLWPEPATDDADLDTVLSYRHPLISGETDELINVTDCVTYLLFPFVTCGATEGWDTGIAIANTSKDVFSARVTAAEQSGSVTVWGFPRSTAAADGSSGELADPAADMVSSSLAAGDTVTFNCSASGLAGVEGYAIARAGFQFAHGMAFVMGSFNNGNGLDVAHGYMALVIPDPEISGQRATIFGESLGQ